MSNKSKYPHHDPRNDDYIEMLYEGIRLGIHLDDFPNTRKSFYKQIYGERPGKGTDFHNWDHFRRFILKYLQDYNYFSDVSIGVVLTKHGVSIKIFNLRTQCDAIITLRDPLELSIQEVSYILHNSENTAEELMKIAKQNWSWEDVFHNMLSAYKRSIGMGPCWMGWANE